jgi:hypothetical protein
MQSTRRLYLTADKSKIVNEGDPAASFLLCGVGGTIDKAYASLTIPPPPGAVVAPAPPAEAEKPTARRPASKPTKPTAGRK